MFDFKYLIGYEEVSCGAEITYDISNINKCWDFLMLSYEICHVDKNGHYWVESSFDLLDKAGNANLSRYPKQDKVNLWKTIFELKDYYFSRSKPDIVEHFIDGEYSYAKRLILYQKYLQPHGYEYVKGHKTNCFYLVKNSVLNHFATDVYRTL